MNKTIVVWYNGSCLTLASDFAELNKIPDGFQIRSESEFWNILREYAKHELSKIKMLVEAKRNTN